MSKSYHVDINIKDYFPEVSGSREEVIEFIKEVYWNNLGIELSDAEIVLTEVSSDSDGVPSNHSTHLYRDDTSSIDDTPARQLASYIIDGNASLLDTLDSIVQGQLDGGLSDERYYELEDELTEHLNIWMKYYDNYIRVQNKNEKENI